MPAAALWLPGTHVSSARSSCHKRCCCRCWQALHYARMLCLKYALSVR